MSKRAQALINLLKAIDADAKVPKGASVADIINAIADAIKAKDDYIAR